MFYTTLNRIRENGPYISGWGKLLKSLGKTKADDEPLSLLEILNSNGLNDALWALRCIDDCPEIRLFAVRCVRQVQHIIKDERSTNALDVAERYAIGEATEEELAAARAAAETAALGAARGAAWLATWGAWGTGEAERAVTSGAALVAWEVAREASWVAGEAAEAAGEARAARAAQ